MRIGVSPLLVAVGRVLLLWIGFRQLQNGQFKTFACPSNTFRKADRHALRRGVLAYSVPHP